MIGEVRRDGQPARRVSWADARAAAFAAASALPTEAVSVLDCAGRILARDVVALQDVPHFASSAMDGWAVAGDGPWLLLGGESITPSL